MKVKLVFVIVATCTYAVPMNDILGTGWTLEESRDNRMDTDDYALSWEDNQDDAKLFQTD